MFVGQYLDQAFCILKNSVYNSILFLLKAGESSAGSSSVQLRFINNLLQHTTMCTID